MSFWNMLGWSAGYSGQSWGAKRPYFVPVAAYMWKKKPLWWRGVLELFFKLKERVNIWSEVCGHSCSTHALNAHLVQLLCWKEFCQSFETSGESAGPLIATATTYHGLAGCALCIMRKKRMIMISSAADAVCVCVCRLWLLPLERWDGGHARQ